VQPEAHLFLMESQHIAQVTIAAQEGRELLSMVNAEIDRVTQENRLIPGPDFYQLFRQNARIYLRDGIHPTPAGARAMNLAWFEALRNYIDH
jgi:acyl-CoA thioesterase-1